MFYGCTRKRMRPYDLSIDEHLCRMGLRCVRVSRENRLFTTSPIRSAVGGGLTQFCYHSEYSKHIGCSAIHVVGPKIADAARKTFLKKFPKLLIF